MKEEEVKRKIAKLFKLAGNNNSKAEVASAIAKVQALMLEHKITKCKLNLEENEEDKIHYDLNREDANNKNVATWKKRLALIIGKQNGVYVFTSGSNIAMVGKDSNVENVRELYNQCFKSIDYLTKKEAHGKGRVYANNFRLGCVDAIQESIREEELSIREHLRKKAEKEGERALVVLSKALIKIDNHLPAAKSYALSKVRLVKRSSRSRYDCTARSHGKHSGSNIYNSAVNKRRLES